MVLKNVRKIEELRAGEALEVVAHDYFLQSLPAILQSCNSAIPQGAEMATIKVRLNGPYLVEGDDVTVVDWNGNPYTPAKRPFALCRCGGSSNKPFCDGTHSRVGFAAAEAAVPGSVDKPAQ